MTRITVLGSLNADTILKMPHLPLPGETIALTAKSTAGGGKGANQAIAAARAGAATTFIGKVGADSAGTLLKDALQAAQVDLEHVTTATDVATGQAYIMLDDTGQNSILIDGGANQTLTVADIEAAKTAITTADFLVAQFETPLAVTLAAFQIAKAAGVTTILNPAPAKTTLPPKLLALTDLIVPNETEASILTQQTVLPNQITTLRAAAAKLQAQGVAHVVITLGEAGAFYDQHGQSGQVPAFKVQAVDTTAAGDTFIGALTAVLAKDLHNLPEALTFASRASALAVQTLGAQPSIPTRQMIDQARF
jgi:ribokinase